MPGTLEHHLRVLFADIDIDLVVDVGAHEGEFGLLTRRSGYEGAIVSYDPLPEPALYSLLDERWSFRRVACSDAAGSATMHHFEGSNFDSLHSPTELNAQRF